MRSDRNIKRKIREIERGLKWPVYRTTHNEALDIISDPRARTHTIRFPAQTGNAGPFRETEILHELAHAYLAERRPVLCVHDYIVHDGSGLTVEEVRPLFSGPVRATADWFADDLLMQWIPREESAEIWEHVEYFRRFLASQAAPDREYFNSFALCFAQAVYYLGATYVPPAYRGAVDCFLSINPRRPSEQAFSGLLNSLLSGISAQWNAEEAVWIIK